MWTISGVENTTTSELGLNSLPDWIGNFKNLEHLHISANQIKELPASLGNLENLKELELNRNPINSPAADFWKKLGYVPSMLGAGYFHANHLEELQKYLRAFGEKM